MIQAWFVISDVTLSWFTVLPSEGATIHQWPLQNVPHFRLFHISNIQLSLAFCLQCHCGFCFFTTVMLNLTNCTHKTGNHWLVPVVAGVRCGD